MNSPKSERQAIIEFSTTDWRQLDMALKIGAAYVELHTHVITRFVGEVAEILSRQYAEHWLVLPGTSDSFSEKWAVFLEVRHRHHNPVLQIVFCGDELEYPKTAYIAVRFSDRYNREEALKAWIDSQFAPGKPSEASLWYRYLDKAHLKWGSDETALEMYRQDSFAERIADQIGRICRAIEDFPD